jgi:hypothetical protein
MDETLRLLDAATSAPASAPAAVIREMSYQDYPQIAALEAKYGLMPTCHKRWINLFDGNPAYRQGWPIGWVIEDADGRIAGAVANIPLRYEFDGRSLLAATGRGWVVDQNYRSHSLSLLARFYANELADIHLITSANANSERAFRLFRCKPVPAGDWNQSAFWITNYVGFASSWLGRKRLVGPGALRYPAAAALWTHDLSWTRPRAPQSYKQAPATWSDGFDERFDSFWSALKERHRGVLMAERSREQLEWHFRPAIKGHRIWIATVIEGSELRAYAVFLPADKPEYGLKRVRLVDFKSLEKNNTDWGSVLLLAHERCRREGVHMLEWVGCPPSCTTGPIKARTRKLDAWSHHYRTTDKELAEALSRPEAWDASLYDGDATL